MTASVLAAVAVLCTGAFIWFANRQMIVLLHTIRDAQPPYTPPLATDEAKWRAVDAQMRLLDEKMERLTLGVSDGISHVERNEKRIRGIVQSARRRFAESGVEDPGVDAEFDTLPELDGAGGGEPRLQDVREDLGGDGEEAAVEALAWSQVPGFGPDDSDEDET